MLALNSNTGSFLGLNLGIVLGLVIGLSQVLVQLLGWINYQVSDLVLVSLLGGYL